MLASVSVDKIVTVVEVPASCVATTLFPIGAEPTGVGVTCPG